MPRSQGQRHSPGIARLAWKTSFTHSSNESIDEDEGRMAVYHCCRALHCCGRAVGGILSHPRAVFNGTPKHSLGHAAVVAARRTADWASVTDHAACAGTEAATTTATRLLEWTQHQRLK